MTLRELASTGVYVSLLSALDLGRFVEGERASPIQAPPPLEPDSGDFEDTLPSWVVSTMEDDGSAAAS